MHRWINFFFIICLALGGAAFQPAVLPHPVLAAADLTVGSAPCQYATITEAMAAAHTGDRLLIEGGVTFAGELYVNKSLTLQGGYPGCGSGSSERTTIDGGGTNRAMYIYGNLNVTLENLNIVNGYTTGSGAGIYVNANTRLTGVNLDIAHNTSNAQGGGLRLLGGTVVLTNTNIHDNTAANGAGVYAEFSNGYAPTLELRESSTIYNNTASDYGGGIYMYGGGIDTSDNGIIKLQNQVEVYANAASDGGGGIYAYDSDIELQNQVEVHHNTASGSDPTSSGGGGFYLDASRLQADRSSIHHNTATSSGGGAYANGGSAIDLRQTFVESNQARFGGGLYAVESPVSLNNTVLAYNNATSASGADGLHLFTGASLSGAHNTFARNSAGGAEDGIAIGLSGATLALSNSIIWGHATSIDNATQTVTCSDIQGGYAGSGNLDLDPLFVNPGSRDFHLAPTSPAINACTTGLDADLDGRARPVGSGYDMGAFEFDALPPSFTSTPLTQVNIGQLYTYPIAAQDDDGGPLAITTTSLPAWLTLVDHGDGTATLSGTPTVAHLGDNAVTLRVTDDTNLYAIQSFVIQVGGGYRIYLPITIK